MANPNIVDVQYIRGRTANRKYVKNESRYLVRNNASSNEILKINTITATNTSNTNQRLTVQLVTTSGTSNLVSNIIIPRKTTLNIIQKNHSIYLEEDSSINVSTTSSNDRIAIFCSYEQISTSVTNDRSDIYDADTGNYLEPVSSGLILFLDPATSLSYPGTGNILYDISGNNNHFTLFNSPTFSDRVLTFNGTNQYARSTNNIDFSSFSSITTMIFARTTATTGGMMFEHTTNWNSVTGGLGLAPHSNGNTNRVDLHHTNHNSVAARNYLFTVGTNWANHTNIFSRVSDATGRLTYNNASLVSFSSEGGYATGTATGAGSFANAQLFIASRGGTGSYCPMQLGAFLIYNRKLTDAEITQNFNALRANYGI